MMKKLLAVVAVFVAVIAFAGCSHDTSSKEPAVWPERGISEVLPIPEFGKLDYVFDSGDSFSADVVEVTRADFESYLQACKTAGFTVDAEESGDSYEAYSEGGYALRLSFFDSMSELGIHLDAPIEMAPITWPTTAPGCLAPVPPTLNGKVVTDNADAYSAYIGEMDRERFGAYVDACINAGFNVDHSRTEELFSAQDAAGNSIAVSYEGFNTVKVTVEKADGGVEASVPSASSDASQTEQGGSVPDSSSDASVSLGVTPEFKKMMDEYEAFFDEYIAFMQSYDESASSADLMMQYSSYMAQYAETMAAVQAVDQESLTEADAVYYTQVMARIAGKLATVA